jgi:hypothetical protein
MKGMVVDAIFAVNQITVDTEKEGDKEMIKPLPATRTPLEIRAMFLGALRTNNYTMKTSEIAAFTHLPTSVVRRCGLGLANESKIEAVLVPGRGKGEYRFTITQLDLFEDASVTGTGFWQKFKKLLRF